MAHASLVSSIMLAARLDLHKVLRPSGYVYASDDNLYKYAFFGRDSIEVAEDLLLYKKEFIYKLIIRLAELQGAKDDPVTEEEPGKIHHEYRAEIMEGKRVSTSSLAILQSLSKEWGGTSTEFVYYGAADTTALFVRLVARFQLAYNTDLLAHAFVSRSGNSITVAQSVEKALGWISESIQKTGAITFCRRNPNGILSQVWKDSPTSLVHSDGTLPNFKKPITTIELQAQGYDALSMGADMLQTYNAEYTARATKWKHQATQLRQFTLRQFWLPNEQRFATGLDKDSSNNWRVIGSNTSNQTAMLESTILVDLPIKEQQKYVMAIIKNIYSHDFLTTVGIRCRSLHEFTNVDFQDYHGSWAVWLKETYDTAKGMRRYGFDVLADQLEYRILKGVSRAGANREFFYVTPSGSVLYQPARQRVWRRTVLATKTIVGTNMPETSQAWTASAVFSIISRKKVPPVAIPKIYSDLQNVLVTYLPKIDQSTFLLPDLLVGFMSSQTYGIDTAAGKLSDDSWRQKATNDQS